MRICCLGDEETVLGFRFVGIDGRVVTSAEGAERLLLTLTESGDCALVILTQQVSTLIPDLVRRLRLGTRGPLLVEVPGPGGPLPGHRSLQDLMQEAVGLRIGEGELTP